MNQLPRPIFGLIARTALGRTRLTPEGLQPWVSRWLSKPDPGAWFIDNTTGVALFQPDAVLSDPTTGGVQALSIRGSLVADAMEEGLDLPPVLGESGLTWILKCLQHRDSVAIRQMRGQFCFAWLDGSKRSFSLVRDHLGQRCLYVRTEPHYFVYCSELSPLLHSPDEANQLDRESAFWYLSFGMPVPGRTLVQHVQRVPAGHVLRWDGKGVLSTQRYWTPLTVDGPAEVTESFLTDARKALDLAVARLSGEGESNGILLSGGVDSTFLAVTARRLGFPLCAFTSAFDEAYGINETDYAGEVAKWLSIPHYIARVDIKDVLSDMEDVLLPAAEPCSAWATLTHFRLLAEAQHRGIKHLISGLGADEIFGGYDHFRGYYARYCRYVGQRRSPPGMDPFDALLAAGSQAATRVLYPGVARFFDDTALRVGLEPPFNDWSYAGYLRQFYGECRRLKPEADVMEMMVAHECQHRIPDLLHANFEPLSRRMGIETVYPFLDPDLVSLVSGLSVASRYRTSKGVFSVRLDRLIPRFKYAMMRIAEDRVPEVIRRRPRSSYTAPFGQWLTQPEFGRYVLNKIGQSTFWEQRMVKRSYLDEMIRHLEHGPGPRVFRLWALFTLSVWYDRFITKQDA